MAFGDLRGTLVVNATSIADPFVATGSVVVRLGDLVYVVVGEQTGNTTIGVTDNLGNTYTQTSAGTATTGTVISGHAFYSRVTAAGTLTAVNADTTASANNAAMVAGVFEGPFVVSPIDTNATNITTDVSSPFACPASSPRTQTDELIIGWSVLNGNVTLSATAPFLTTTALRQSTASVLSVTIGYQPVHATGSVTPTFTGTNPSVQVLGTTSFKADVDAMAWRRDQSFPQTPNKISRIAAVALIASGLIAPPFEVPPPVEPPDAEVLFTQSPIAVPYQRVLLYQSIAEPVRVVTVAEGTAALQADVSDVDGAGDATSLPGNNDVLFSEIVTGVPYARTRIYQSLAQPVRVTAEQITADKWFVPLQTPPFGGYASIDLSATFLAVERVAIGTGVLLPGRSTVAGSGLAGIAEPGNNDVLFSELISAVPFSRARLYQSVAQPVQVTVAAVTGTGALQAPAPTVAGAGTVRWVGTGTLQPTASSITSSGGISLSFGGGTLPASASGIYGTEGIVPILGTGSLQAQVVTVNGIAVSRSTGTGAAASPAAALSATGISRSFGTGTAAAQSSVLFGTPSQIGTGELQAQTAAVAGLGDAFVTPTPTDQVITLGPSDRAIELAGPSRTIVPSSSNRTIIVDA